MLNCLNGLFRIREAPQRKHIFQSFPAEIRPSANPLTFHVFTFSCLYDGTQFIEIKTAATASPSERETEKHQLPDLGYHKQKKTALKSRDVQKLEKEIKHW